MGNRQSSNGETCPRDNGGRCRSDVQHRLGGAIARVELHARDQIIRKPIRIERHPAITRYVEDLPIGENAAIAEVRQLRREDVASPAPAVDFGRRSREILAVIQQFVVATDAAGEADKVVGSTKMQAAVGEPRGADRRERRVSAVLRQIHQGRRARNRQCRRPGSIVKIKIPQPRHKTGGRNDGQRSDGSRTISDVEQIGIRGGSVRCARRQDGFGSRGVTRSCRSLKTHATDAAVDLERFGGSRRCIGHIDNGPGGGSGSTYLRNGSRR